eukprot:11625453-Heterocapsa_arctica.AAC.1
MAIFSMNLGEVTLRSYQMPSTLQALGPSSSHRNSLSAATTTATGPLALLPVPLLRTAASEGLTAISM